AGECGLNSRQLTHRSDVAVRLKEGSQGDVGAAISVSDGRLERPLEHDLASLDRLNRLARDAGDDPLLKCARAGLALLELDGGAGCIYDGEGGIDHLRADSITR